MTWVTRIEHLAIVAEIEASKDRAAAIVTCAFIEELLGERLKRELRKGSETVKSMLKPNGLLGSLFARNTLAYAMNLYDETTRHNISVIGDVRNAFAHQSKTTLFKDKLPSQLCATLKSELGSLSITIRAGDKLPIPEPREHFLWVAQDIILKLITPDAEKGLVLSPSPRKFGKRPKP